MKLSSLVISLLMLAIFAGALLIASAYPEGARFQPYVIAIPAVALCVLQLILDIREARLPKEKEERRNEFEKAQEQVSRSTGREVRFEVADAQAAADQAILPQDGSVVREIIVWAYFLGFIAGVLAFGFWISIPVFIFLFLLLQARARWTTALSGSVLATAIFYGLFTFALKVTLHEGFLTPHLQALIR